MTITFMTSTTPAESWAKSGTLIGGALQGWLSAGAATDWVGDIPVHFDR